MRFREFDYRAVFGTMAKWVVEVDRVERLPELVSCAWTVALGGQPGPVVVALPEDMLAALTDVPPLTHPVPISEPAPDVVALGTALDMMAGASRPLILLGGCNWRAEGKVALQAFAEASDIPVLVDFRCHDLIDNHAGVYAGEAGVGMPAHVARLLREADVIFAVNSSFGEMTADAYTLLAVPDPVQRLIHVHADAAELGKIYRPTLGITAGPNRFAAALSPVKGDWGAWRAGAREGYVASLEAPPQPSPVDMAAVSAHLRTVLPPDVIVTNGAGNFAVWPNKHLVYGPDARLLAPQSGAMGYGVAAAVAAKIACPDRLVVCFAWDGDFQMTGAELATARQAGAAVVILILNNGIYGTIRAHQERHFPARVSGTDMVNPDFVLLAQAHGLHAERVSSTADFADAFTRACASPAGAVLDLVISAEALTPRASLSQIRAAAQARQAAKAG